MDKEKSSDLSSHDIARQRLQSCRPTPPPELPAETKREGKGEEERSGMTGEQEVP